MRRRPSEDPILAEVAIATDVCFGIQVQFCQYHPGSSLIGAAVLVLASRHEQVFACLEFAFNLVEHLFGRRLTREK